VSFLTIWSSFPGAKVIEDLLPGWTALAQDLGAIMYEPGTVKTVIGNVIFLPHIQHAWFCNQRVP